MGTISLPLEMTIFCEEADRNTKHLEIITIGGRSRLLPSDNPWTPVNALDLQQPPFPNTRVGATLMWPVGDNYESS